MHIHNQMNPMNAANFYGAAQNDRAEANRRAAETRRKLALSASRASGDSLADEETFLVGHWLGAGAQPPDSFRGGEDGSDDHGEGDRG